MDSLEAQKTKAEIDFLKTQTAYMNFQMRVKCKNCERTYDRRDVKSDCECGAPLRF